jgi:hypothetical protein
VNRSAAVRTRSTGILCEASGCNRPHRPRHGVYCSDACRARAWRRHQEQARLPFDPPLRPLPVTNTPSPESRTRLQRACWRILEELARHPATNTTLAAVGGLRYGARLRELREAEYVIHMWQDKGTGLAVYWSRMWMES